MNPLDPGSLESLAYTAEEREQHRLGAEAAKQAYAAFRAGTAATGHASASNGHAAPDVPVEPGPAPAVIEAPAPSPAPLCVDDHDTRELRKSGLSDATIIANNLSTTYNVKAVSQIVGRKLRFAEFLVAGKPTKFDPATFGALEFRIRRPGEPDPYTSRFKLHIPRVKVELNERTDEWEYVFDGDGKHESVKYEQPSKKIQPHCAVFYGAQSCDPARLQDASIPITVTEGEKKALALEQCGLLAIGLAGIWNWTDSDASKAKQRKVLHPDIAGPVNFRGRGVTIFYDYHEHKSKPDEPKAARALADVLYELGAAEVRRAWGPSAEIKGPDDALVDFAQRPGQPQDLGVDCAISLDLEQGKTRMLEYIEQNAKVLPRKGERADARADSDASNGDTPRDIASVNWRSKLTRNRKGELTATPANFEAHLRFHEDWIGKLRFNSRSGVVLVEPGSPISQGATAPRELIDADFTRIAIWFERLRDYIAVSPASASLVGAIGVVARDHAFDPVVLYLDSTVWDGVERIDLLLTRYFTGEDTPLHRAFGRCWMIGAVARAFEPGCQCDYTLIICGAQGLRKSTAFIVLAGHPEWFTDSVPGFNDPKRFAEVIAGCWLVELAELDSVARSEMSAVKALLTARYDKYRAPWGKVAESHPRRAVFCATTNDLTLFRDHTGARRFWPVAVSRVDIDALTRDRDQLWAEAAARYRAGEPWHLTDPKLIEAAETSQEARRAPDPWEDKLASYLSICERAESAAAKNEGRDPRVVRVTLDALLGKSTTLDLRTDRWDAASANRVGRILQRLGWARRQRRDGPDKRRRWAYERVAVDPDAVDPKAVEPETVERVVVDPDEPEEP